MTQIEAAGALVTAYLIGSVPFGLVIVRAVSGVDLRQVHSGRTGGSNAARAAGVLAGVATALGDVLKSAAVVLLARAVSGAESWLPAASGFLAVLGHNHSVFLLERVNGKLRLRGGAGGAPTVGAAIALWPPSALVLLPVGILVLITSGFASLATLSVGLSATGVFLWRASSGAGPWEHVLFAALTVGLLAWGLRPNLQRLREGTERRLSWGRRRSGAAKVAAGDEDPPS